MKGWSKEIKKLTRKNVGSGAALKSWDGEFGIFGLDEEKSDKLHFPIPSDKVIATFASIDEMIDAGWVLD